MHMRSLTLWVISVYSQSDYCLDGKTYPILHLMLRNIVDDALYIRLNLVMVSVLVRGIQLFRWLEKSVEGIDTSAVQLKWRRMRSLCLDLTYKRFPSTGVGGWLPECNPDDSLDTFLFFFFSCGSQWNSVVKSMSATPRKTIIWESW